MHNLRHNIVAAQHTITQSSYNIDITYCGYLMMGSTFNVGPILMALPKCSDCVAFPGSHNTWTVGVMKFPDGADNPVSVVTQPGDTIADPRAVSVGSNYKIDIVTPAQILWFWTDGARWIIPMTNGL